MRISGTSTINARYRSKPTNIIHSLIQHSSSLRIMTQKECLHKWQCQSSMIISNKTTTYKIRLSPHNIRKCLCVIKLHNIWTNCCITRKCCIPIKPFLNIIVKIDCITHLMRILTIIIYTSNIPWKSTISISNPSCIKTT